MSFFSQRIPLNTLRQVSLIINPLTYCKKEDNEKTIANERKSHEQKFKNTIKIFYLKLNIKIFGEILSSKKKKKKCNYDCKCWNTKALFNSSIWKL